MGCDHYRQIVQDVVPVLFAQYIAYPSVSRRVGGLNIDPILQVLDFHAGKLQGDDLTKTDEREIFERYPARQISW